MKVRSLLPSALLVATTALGGHQSSGTPARVVHIAAERFAFTPSRIVVEEGTTVELRLTSDDTDQAARRIPAEECALRSLQDLDPIDAVEGDVTIGHRHELQDALARAGTVVLPIFSKISASKGRSGITPKLRDAGTEILHAAKAAGRTSVVISFDSPYILTFFREADILVAAYDGTEEIQRAAVDLLAGEA